MESDTSPQSSHIDFKKNAELAAYIGEAPIAVMSVLTGNKRFFGVGLNPSASFSCPICSGMVPFHNGPIVVHDIARDLRYNELNRQSGTSDLQFFAGFPLLSDTGELLGALTIWDYQPRGLKKRTGTRPRPVGGSSCAISRPLPPR